METLLREGLEERIYSERVLSIDPIFTNTGNDKAKGKLYGKNCTDSKRVQ